LGRALAREWLLAGGLPVIRVLPQEEDRTREIVARYSDKDWTLCDAISFAVLHVRGVRRFFTFDRHFLQYSGIEVLGLSR
jgi:predicted nucleic acid-binding protein